MSDSALLRTALDYAHRGWPVVPLWWPEAGGCTCSNGQGCSHPGKHPIGHLVPHGLKQASADPATIKRWWRRYPSANIGLATGVGFDVLDLDGPDALLALVTAQAGRELPPGPQVLTGRGHHLYHLPTGLGCRTGFLPGCDYKGRGGMVTAPPSLHVTGVRYCWAVCDGPDGVIDGPDEPLTPLPGWLRDLVRPPRRKLAPSSSPSTAMGHRAAAYARSALEREVGRVACAVEGTRNNMLNRASHALGQLIGGGALDVDIVIEQLLVAAERAGLSQREAVETIRSGLRAGARQPRGVPA